MDESWEKWFSDLEMDECHLFNEQDINSIEEELKGESSVLPELCCESLSFDSDSTAAAKSNNMGNASSSLEENTQHASNSDKLNFSSYNLSFEDSTAVPNVLNKTCQHHGKHAKETQEKIHNRNSKRDRNSSETQDHIIAERKRREKLGTMFTALSAIIPGLKKTDKLSIISNTIDYVKYLQNRVRDLEEQNKKTKFVMCFKNNKPDLTVVDDISRISYGLNRLTFPNVNASVTGEDVIIRVICDKREDIITKLLSKLATYNLSIVCSNVMPFANSTLSISIIAKVEREFSMAMDDLVKNLNEDLLKYCNLQQ